MARITNMQNEIAQLQKVLSERNETIADLRRKYSEANQASQKTIDALRAEIAALKAPKAEAA
jgi:predicted  nucleic acid-binding Zn-ribbon protein